MKRLISILLVLSLLLGCQQRTIAQLPEPQESPTASAAMSQPAYTDTPSPIPATPEPTATPRPSLPTFAPTADREALFPEELISPDGEPIASLVRSLLESEGLTKAEFYDRLLAVIDQIDELDQNILLLSDRGRTLTADRKEKTILSLLTLVSDDTQVALQDAYSKCSGEGEDLPLAAYAASVDAVVQDVERMEDRTATFFQLGSSVSKEYLIVLGRYMGEPVVPMTVFQAMEDLAQTEAYALNAALRADPEAARKKAPISFGTFEENIAFLRRVTEDLGLLSDGSALPMPLKREGAEDMSLMELAFHYYPGMAFLNAYAAQESEAQQARWANASDGYLAGLAVHCSYAVVPYLGEYGLDYVQYRWYEDMLDVTLTGISALLIHYYGYSLKSLKEYLASWGAEDFAGYLYEKALSDPFDSLATSYGYIRYLYICQAALDAGCPTEKQFLQDYLKAGPAPYEKLKEYMVSLYKNQG